MISQRLPGWLALLAFVMYAFAPGAPELAEVSLGVADAGGFPLYAWLVQLAAWLPLGELPFRAHLLSALAAALAVFFVAKLVLRVAGADEMTAVVGAIVAAILLTLATTFFRHATIGAVYAPTAALFAASLYLAMRVGQGAGAPAMLALALLAGLGGAGLCASYRLLLGPPLLVLYAWRLRCGARSVLAAPTLVALGALGVLAYAPVVAEWGQLGQTRAHPIDAPMTGARGAEQAGARAGAFYARVQRYVLRVERDVGVLALLAAALGVWALMRVRKMALAGLLLFVLAGDLLRAVWTPSPGMLEPRSGAPFLLATSVLVGVGLALTCARAGRAGVWIAATWGVLVVTPVVASDWSVRWTAARSAVPATEPHRRAEGPSSASPGFGD